ncbi:WD40 repeat domain-containing protein [Novipirellula artificiosorum]|uniref:WD domain, G-beta repeat n=1 Tax=Novipirellula artificiosorum TaxID=2528016 RepID=A0A5C6DZQ4_9BACT|nr:hypothetical protein [Novipirellula artificiosorum]TWU40941.1 WD domain, G-beta repeat [Novipirellula artificiosorum]
MRCSPIKQRALRRASRYVSLLITLITSSLSQAQPPITALEFAPSDDAVVVGSQAGLEVRQWPSLAESQKNAMGITQIHDLKFSPNGQYLLIVGGSPSEFGEWQIVLWPELTKVASSTAHDDVIYSAVWIRQDRFVTGAADNQLIEWQWSDGAVTQRRRLIGHSRRVLSVEYLADSKGIVSAGVDQSLRLWTVFETAAIDAARNNEAPPITLPIRTLDNHTGIVRDLATRPGDHAIPYLASASVDKTVRLWQPSIGRLVRFARLPAEPLSIAWSHDGERLAVACVDGKLRLLNPNTVEIEQELEAINGWAYEVLAAPDGSFLVGGTAGELIRVLPKSER